MNTYKIIMLGSSGAGKTVFLSSLFKELAIQGEHGFFLEVEDKAKAKLLNETYVEVATGDKWPAPTQRYDGLSEWTFTCCVRTQNLSIHPACKFTYLDYAGGMLTEVYEETEGDIKIEDQIKNADALLGLLDGGKIAAFMNNGDERKTAILLHTTNAT
jgi:GTPase SAR1 family protein